MITWKCDSWLAMQILSLPGNEPAETGFGSRALKQGRFELLPSPPLLLEDGNCRASYEISLSCQKRMNRELFDRSVVYESLRPSYCREISYLRPRRS